MKLLVVEDDLSLLEVMTNFLEGERYVVETASTFQQALRKVEDYDYDCILLDVMLPDGSGLDLLKALREANRFPSVIILSARNSIEDKVSGLELGADDYLPKPFHLAELNARIKSITRRRTRDGAHVITYGNAQIYPDNFEVKICGAPVELIRKEFDILLYFVMRPNRLINKQTLAEAVWGDHFDQVDNFDFMYAQIKNLRKRLKDARADFEIKSVYGVGYKLQRL